MGGKGSEPEPPDYTAVAEANRESAQISAEVAREQLAWAREQYAQDRGVTDQVVSRMLGTMDSEAAAGAADRQRYQNTFQPLEDRLVRDSVADRNRYESIYRPLEDRYVQDALTDRDRYRQNTVPLEDALAAEARDYDTAARRELNAGRAVADVTAQFDGARRGALAQLESYGVDPSQTRAGALDLGVRTAQAAAAAGAANQSRLQTEDTARALRADAINTGRLNYDTMARAASMGAGLQGSIGNAVNVGRGYPGQVASAYQTSQNAGQGAVSSGLATTASGAGSMGTGLGWQGQANSALGNWGNQTVGLSGQATGAGTAAANRQSSMWGTGLGVVGGVVGSYFGPVGTMIGSAAGRYLGGAIAGENQTGGT